jgi:hypothetical protein
MHDVDATPTYTTHALRIGSEDKKTTTGVESEVLQQDTLAEIINYEPCEALGTRRPHRPGPDRHQQAMERIYTHGVVFIFL